MATFTAVLKVEQIVDQQHLNQIVDLINTEAYVSNIEAIEGYTPRDVPGMIDVVRSDIDGSLVEVELYEGAFEDAARASLSDEAAELADDDYPPEGYYVPEADHE